MKVLNFGSCNIDYVYLLSHFVNSGETTNAHNMAQSLGGKGFNQSIAIAKSGEKVYHVGNIGQDGAAFRSELEKLNINVDFLKTVDAPTGHAIIQVNDKGENCIIIYSGANFCVTEDFVDDVISNFEKDDIIVLQNEINNLEYIVSAAYKKGMKICLNPSPFNDVIETLDFNKLYAIFINEVEGYQLTGKKIPKEILSCLGEKYNNLKIVLTLGSKGSMYYSPATEEEYICPAFNVKVEDTTSAGDTFLGYFIYGLINELNIEEVLKIASVASALAVSKKGSSNSIPEISEVKKALKTLKPNKLQKLNEEELILEYIKNNLLTANLNDLTGIINYSSSVISGKVKKITGYSFTKLIQKARLERAGELLRDSELSINEIINCVGYENGSFFRKIFYKEFGKSLLEYRKFYKGR